MSVSMYLSFAQPEIAGSSTAPDHHGEIEVLAWSHGFVQPTSPSRGAGGTGPVEQATHQNLTFTKYLDASTNQLLKACWSGRQFGRATLTCLRADRAGDKPAEYLGVVMEHVVISKYSISGGPGELPLENVSLDYGIVQYRYTPLKPDAGSGASTSARHNLEARTVE
jgi:type VI secretion system secreted protein Hcp